MCLASSCPGIQEKRFFFSQQEACKQMEDARRKISAVRSLVKQLPAEKFQQRSNASSCMRMRIVMEEHLHRMSAFHAFSSK
jgi:hypothetical protein